MGFVVEQPLPVTKRVRAISVLCVVLVVAVGAALFVRSRPGVGLDTTSRTAAGVTVLIQTDDYNGALTAEGHGGQLTVLDGCLGFTDGSLVVFPKDTHVKSSGGQVAVRVRNAVDGSTETLRPGDEVVWGGHVVAPVSITQFGEHLADHVPVSCRDRKVVAADGGIGRLRSIG